MPLIYIGNNQHFLRPVMEVKQIGLRKFHNSSKVFITLQNVKDSNEVCTIEQKDSWHLEDKERITCDLVQIFCFTDCISQYTIPIAEFFLHNVKKHLPELLEWHQERWSNIGSKVIPNVETNPTEAFNPFSDKYPWMLNDYVYDN